MSSTELLRTPDYVLIAVYLVGIIVVGSLLARGQKTSDDYFVAGRRMHWFPLALSIWASLTSANSMLGGPAYGYSQDLQYVSMSLVSLLGALFAIYLVLPLLHPLRLTTAYTYLEKRYSLPVRSAGSAFFILLRGGWLASVIYAPSLALSRVIPLPRIDNVLGPVAAYCGTDGSTIFWILVVGLGATIYTVLGGLKAVIWTDVAQFFVFVVGIASIWFLLLSETGATTLVSQLGNIPRAFAGNNRQAAWGQHVQLDGLQSRSFDGTELAFQWRQLEAAGDVATVRLAGATTSTPSFIAPDRPSDGEPATLTFALRVTTDGDPPLQSPPAIVRITIRDDPQSVVKGSPPAYHERPHDTWFDFRLKFIFGTGVTFWVLLVGNLLLRVNDSGTDQVALQRYFSASSLRGSKRAIWLNALCDLPLMTLLYLTGAGVLVYYGIQHNPDVPADSGQVMPFFVAHKLNTILPGLAGLFIAALFAATMSSVDSGINSISASIITDWYRRLLVRDRDEAHYLASARWTTLVLGVLATTSALFLGQIGELWQISVALMGFWTGPLLGIFLLGFFTRRANSLGALFGALVGLVCTCWFQQAGGNEFLYAFVGFVPAVVIGYATSLLWPPPDEARIQGLTYWTRGDQPS